MLADIGKCSRSGEPVRQDFLFLFSHASSAPLAHFADPSSAFPCLPLTFLIVLFSVVTFLGGFSFHEYIRPPCFLLASPSPSYTLLLLNANVFFFFCAQVRKRLEKAKGSG